MKAAIMEGLREAAREPSADVDADGSTGSGGRSIPGALFLMAVGAAIGYLLSRGRTTGESGAGLSARMGEMTSGSGGMVNQLNEMLSQSMEPPSEMGGMGPSEESSTGMGGMLPGSEGATTDGQSTGRSMRSRLLRLGVLAAVTYLLRRRSGSMGETISQAGDRTRNVAEATASRAGWAAQRIDAATGQAADRIQRGGEEAADRLQERGEEAADTVQARGEDLAETTETVADEVESVGGEQASGGQDGAESAGEGEESETGQGGSDEQAAGTDGDEGDSDEE